MDLKNSFPNFHLVLLIDNKKGTLQHNWFLHMIWPHHYAKMTESILECKLKKKIRVGILIYWIVWSRKSLLFFKTNDSNHNHRIYPKHKWPKEMLMDPQDKKQNWPLDLDQTKIWKASNYRSLNDWFEAFRQIFVFDVQPLFF